MVPILASIFGGKLSAGILLPMLCFGDLFGVKYYSRHADWSHLVKLLPWAFAGILIGLYTGTVISDKQFKTIIAVIVLISLVIMIWQERDKVDASVPSGWWFSALTGLLGGFSTMIGNVAGPIMSMYFLSMRLPKYIFIGTAAWFFLIVNFVKAPLNYFFWNTITPETLLLDVSMIPAIAIGAFTGVYVVKKIPEKAYRIFVIVVTIISALRLFF
jgi:uncharacterized membrane protein YfcA